MPNFQPPSCRNLFCFRMEPEQIKIFTLLLTFQLCTLNNFTTYVCHCLHVRISAARNPSSLLFLFPPQHKINSTQGSQPFCLRVQFFFRLPTTTKTAILHKFSVNIYLPIPLSLVARCRYYFTVKQISYNTFFHFNLYFARPLRSHRPVSFPSAQQLSRSSSFLPHVKIVLSR